MIKDKLENAKIYYSLSERIKKGLTWLNENNLNELADGRYELDGDLLFASIQTYNTKLDAKYEAHRNYIDIQYMIDGCEKIGIRNLNDCKSVIEYDSERDLEFFVDINAKEEYLSLKTGEFMILYPQDAHKPSIAIDNYSKKVKKVVVKVAS